MYLIKCQVKSEWLASTHCINFKAKLEPQGIYSGRSNTFPKSISSAEYASKNLPLAMHR